ncbi:MAG: 3-oxoacyl-ACP synthase III [Nitrospinae bacterium]|nr:3-oxoacyl-ACP synthase III [Nitrospinota bacterium]
MRYKNVRLASFGYELAPNVVTSADLEERLTPLYDRLRLPKGRLELMTGIRERRFWNKGERPSSAAVRAGEKALRASGLDKEVVKGLCHGAVCRDFLEPATASVEHHRLGLPADAMIFDVSNACLGLLDGMILLANMIELGQIPAGIALAGEMGESLVEATIRHLNDDQTLTRQSVKAHFASLTIGSGAAAVVLAHKDLCPDGHKLLGGAVRCRSEHSALCASDQDTGFGATAAPLMSTDSEELLHAGCSLAAETWGPFLGEMGWAADMIDASFTHQVGAAHRKLMYRSIGLPEEKDFETVSFLGNVGSVSAPITLALGAERGHVKPGDKVAVLGIGSGLNCMMLGIEWGGR